MNLTTICNIIRIVFMGYDENVINIGKHMYSLNII